MSTTNTTSEWYWYAKQKGRRLWLGLVDGDGAAPSSAYEIKIRCNKYADEVEDEDSLLDIAPEFELGFAQGIAYELMKMDTKADVKTINVLKQAYDEMKAEMIARNFRETQTPCIQHPFDFRDD
jgi:hypothetical protein